jgi:hypothetical protein
LQALQMCNFPIFLWLGALALGRLRVAVGRLSYILAQLKGHLAPSNLDLIHECTTSLLILITIVTFANHVRAHQSRTDTLDNARLCDGDTHGPWIGCRGGQNAAYLAMCETLLLCGNYCALEFDLKDTEVNLATMLTDAVAKDKHTFGRI